MVSPDSSDDTTQLLIALRRGERAALDRLLPRIYDELHHLAHRALSRHRDHGALRTTGLVHEAYLKLVGGERLDVEDRAHFFALAATAMRHIVIDRARKDRARRRGGGWRRIPLADDLTASEQRCAEIIEVHEALSRLERFDERLSKVVECRFFGGLTVEETGAALGVSPRTVDRAWAKARAWLYREMHEA